ncbi:MAG: UDP-N-acetylmuramoyl-L-alanine--D-glutamate ligase [Bacillus sp. (in: Bacteria)]|nr:UDP-N-acetylmuramoyl-L-alanine--D-glutamate ligase [Bacillus sp. (in: firmicutes)]
MRNTTKYTDKNILVLGLAKSGTAAAELLIQLGAKVTVNDRKPLEENEEGQKLQQLGAEVICGSHPLNLVNEQLDFLVKNPGIPYTNPLIEKAMKLGIPIITEVEIAYDISEADIIGITGSNGKTTTTTYIQEMLTGSNKTPLIAGNIGKVAVEVAKNAGPDNILVTELSSFQLMGTVHFRPKISVLLNLVEAHLDYHGSMENYVQAKSNVFSNQVGGDYIIYNYDDEIVKNVVTEGQAEVVPFSVKEYLPGGASIKDGMLMLFGRELISVEEMSLPGEHNIANGLAAAAAAYLAGAELKRIVEVLKTFSGVEHRLQFVANYEGRTFYNNSKATNVPAAITSLKAFQEPVILIAGGLDRGLSFTDLIPYLEDKVKCVVTYGETKEKIAETAKQANVPTVVTVEELPEAVNVAYKNSDSGDVILLSPACASWDQFKTFEERGTSFVQAVKKIVQ